MNELVPLFVSQFQKVCASLSIAIRSEDTKTQTNARWKLLSLARANLDNAGHSDPCSWEWEQCNTNPPVYITGCDNPRNPVQLPSTQQLLVGTGRWWMFMFRCRGGGGGGRVRYPSVLSTDRGEERHPSRAGWWVDGHLGESDQVFKLRFVMMLALCFYYGAKPHHTSPPEHDGGSCRSLWRPPLHLDCTESPPPPPWGAG